MRRLLVLLLGLLVTALLASAPAFARGEPASLASPDAIGFADLPAEARSTIAAIRRGGPYPYAKDGVVFGNREGLLPRQPRGYYSEYTVRTPGTRGRGARRIVVGGPPAESRELYFTDDHYQTFKRIRE